MKRRMIIALAISVAILGLTVISSGLWWPAYARHVFFVGRLHGKIETGDTLGDVWHRTENVAARYAHRKQLHVSSGLAAEVPGWSHHLCDDGRRPTTFIHVYDYHVMDDIQLYVWFDESGTVCGQTFWGD